MCVQAQSQEDAEDGIKFMQEMIELAKRRNDESGMGSVYSYFNLRCRKAYAIRPVGDVGN